MSDSEECHGDPESNNQDGEEPPTDTERLTAQWSVEDEEEAARERRRREREKLQQSQAEDGLNNANSLSESGLPVQENQFDFKPSGTSELEEDEGFSDWSQKLEQRKQRWAAEGTQEGEQTSPREWTQAREAAPTCIGERSPRHSYEEEDSGLREAEVKLEQVQLNQEGPEEIPGENEEMRQEPLETEEPQQLLEAECIQEHKEEEEEEEKAGQEEKKRRRNEEEETPEKRQKAPSTSSVEGEEDEQCDSQSPASSTTITDRTESLNRSIKKSNSVKKTQPPLPVSKIDDRLEQYTHAIETSEKVQKLVRQSSLELATTSMVVASTKNLWETGEVAAQSSVKSPSCKDIVAGDIVNKRSMWEQKGTPKNEGNIKTTASGKKYKFVATGHGQYKKVLIDDTTEQ
ncbi:lymphocyte-specific protein 1 isoform X1 [Dermochelys coriacea]|uniref:lymphocyte-specific protein 1 isoform X1 n=1 Tax=Dermochelys coriacea TaxID=27794 RepID=UPI0018E7EB14|nr:lymphocyte-specific protein 1 isoform X1 [Dermochelys coriacea]XP_038263035.1 lymphocyte-specific protein 1 isoform X1 [Dermochelys coriacea]